MPVPGDISAAFRTLADAFERMRQDNGGDENGLLQSLVESLMGDAESPPREVQGVPDSFLDGECDLCSGMWARVRVGMGVLKQDCGRGRMRADKDNPSSFSAPFRQLCLKFYLC